MLKGVINMCVRFLYRTITSHWIVYGAIHRERSVPTRTTMRMMMTTYRMGPFNPAEAGASKKFGTTRAAIYTLQKGRCTQSVHNGASSEQWSTITSTMQGSAKQQAVSLYFTADYRQMLGVWFYSIYAHATSALFQTRSRRYSRARICSIGIHIHIHLSPEIESRTHFIVIASFNRRRALDWCTEKNRLHHRLLPIIVWCTIVQQSLIRKL